MSRTLRNMVDRLEDSMRARGELPADLLQRDPEGASRRMGPGGWSIDAEAQYQAIHLANMTRLEIERSNRRHEVLQRLQPDPSWMGYQPGEDQAAHTLRVAAVIEQAEEILRRERPELFCRDPEREELDAQKAELGKPPMLPIGQRLPKSDDPLTWALDGEPGPVPGAGGSTAPEISDEAPGAAVSQQMSKPPSYQPAAPPPPVLGTNGGGRAAAATDPFDELFGPGWASH